MGRKGKLDSTGSKNQGEIRREETMHLTPKAVKDHERKRVWMLDHFRRLEAVPKMNFSSNPVRVHFLTKKGVGTWTDPIGTAFDDMNTIAGLEAACRERIILKILPKYEDYLAAKERAFYRGNQVRPLLVRRP